MEPVDTRTALQELKDNRVNMERIPMEDVFHLLRTTPEGLTAEQGELRTSIFGPNKLEEKRENKFIKFLGFMWNPLSWVMESSAVMAVVLANGSRRPPDWQDFIGIISLLIVNSTISFIKENNASNAAAALLAGLAPKARSLRDGVWSEHASIELVPGDIISIKLGDIIPADARLLLGDPLKIDQSSLTGESLPVTKHSGDSVYSGSTCKQGEIRAVVIATGINTFFGKAAYLVNNTKQVGHFQEVLTSIGNFCIGSIFIGMFLEISIMYGVQHRHYRSGIDNLLVLMIGGVPIALPTVLSITMAIGSHGLSQQGAIAKRMTAIEELAGMDILCSDKTGTLTLNKLSIDDKMIEFFTTDIDKELIILLAARASRTENQDPIDLAIINMLDDPKEARADIQEVHFLPFNPTDKRTAITYITNDGEWHRASKGAPEQILALVHNRIEISGRVHAVIEQFAEHGLRSLAVARQLVPERTQDSAGAPWEFCGIMPVFDPPRHDSAETIRRALELGINVKMITGDQLAIAKETGRRLGMGTNMFPSSVLINHNMNRLRRTTSEDDEFIEMADGFAGVFPEHKYEIVKMLQQRKHICGMTGDGVNDAPALKKADVGIAVANATDAARTAADIVLTEPGLSVIICAVLTSRAIFQRMKNYTTYAVSITIRIVVGFVLLALIWQFDFSPFMVLVIALLNDGTIMTISKDRVKPSPMPDSWKLEEIFSTGVVLGVYLAMTTLVFFWLVHDTTFFQDIFGLMDIASDKNQLTNAVYLQVSIVSQALIFVTRTRTWFFLDRPGYLLILAFCLAQLAATFFAVYGSLNFASMSPIGWGWAGIIWLYSIVSYLPLDMLKLSVQYALSGGTCANLLEKGLYSAVSGREDLEKWEYNETPIREVLSKNDQIALAAVTDINQIFESRPDLRIELARIREENTLRGHIEALIRDKGLDMDRIGHGYTL